MTNIFCARRPGHKRRSGNTPYVWTGFYYGFLTEGREDLKPTPTFAGSDIPFAWDAKPPKETPAARDKGARAAARIPRSTKRVNIV